MSYRQKKKALLRGRVAEWIAVFFLFCKGYKPIARNIRGQKGSGAGEIDLIVKRQNLLVFVEIKHRQSLEKASYAVSPLQQKRLYKGAEAFIKNHPNLSCCNTRFDAFLSSPGRLRHIEDIIRQ